MDMKWHLTVGLTSFAPIFIVTVKVSVKDNLDTTLISMQIRFIYVHSSSYKMRDMQTIR